MHRTATPLAIVLSATLAPGALATPFFSGVGALGLNEDGSFSFSRIAGLSDDGGVAVGLSTSPQGQRAVRWTRDGGLEALAPIPGGSFFDNASSVSGDGSTIGGVTRSPTASPGGLGEATTWTNGVPSAMGFITPTSFDQSSIVSITSDASVMVGLSSNTGVFEFEATRWVGGVAESLGTGNGSSATAISQDGAHIAGSRAGTNGAFLGAFLWTEQGVTELRDLAVSMFFDTGATALDISADGSQIIGWATDTFNQRPVMWDTSGTPTDLGVPLGFDGGLANAISDDGTIVVGSASGFAGETAFLWTESTGTIEMAAYLAPFIGSQLDGWTLTSADAISADGKTFAGVGINPQGVTEGWVATIPSPGAIVLLGAGTLTSRRRRTH